MLALIRRFNRPPLVAMTAVALLLACLDPPCQYHCNQVNAKGHGKSTAEPSSENFDEGMRRFKAKEYDGAVDSFLQSIYFARNGYCPQGYFWLGKSYFAKGGQDLRAIDAFNKFVEQSLKEDPEAHYLLGELYLRNHRLDEADKEAGICLDKSDSKSDRAKAYYLLGNVAEAQDNIGQAITCYMSALGDLPWRYTEAWLAYGEALMKQKNYEKAFLQFRNLLNSPLGLKNVPFDRVYYDVGMCMFIKGDHQGALDNWRKSLTYNPDNAAAHLQIAMCFDKEKHFSSAIQEYKEFIRLCPDPKTTSQIKDRVAILEQQLNPTPEPVRPPPPREPIKTPEQIEAEKRQLEKEKETLNPISPQRGDPGF